MPSHGIILGHMCVYVFLCVFVVLAGSWAGAVFGPMAAAPDVLGLSVKDCSTEPKEEESSAAWLRERRNRCGELKRDLQLLHPIVLNAASTVWVTVI